MVIVALRVVVLVLASTVIVTVPSLEPLVGDTVAQD
jgi:hypothetical protein